MNVLVDAHMLGEQEGGNESYIAGLLNGLAANGDRDVAINVLLNARYAPPPQLDSLRAFRLGKGGNFNRVFLRIPRLCRAAQVDVVHVTYNVSPVMPAAVVVSVHDVIFRRFPQYFSPRVRLLLGTLLPLSMRRANVILTSSEASKQDISAYYPFAKDKVRVIPIGPGAAATAPPDPRVAATFAAGRPFILAVGTVQPRKNMARLVQAYTLARQRGLTDARLVIVGRAAWQHSEIHKLAVSSRYSDDICFTGYLDDAAVAALYRSCAAFVYPSLYEGFGLPVVEAMACGAAVITSDLSSLPEVAGDAALLVDPYSVEELAAAIGQVLGDQVLRDELRTRGRRQAARFSWTRTAQETLAAYKLAHTLWRQP